MIEPAGGDLTNAETASIAQTEQVDRLNASKAVADAASGTATTADQAALMDGSAGNFLNSAGGGFKLDPAAAAALAESCLESIHLLEGIQGDVDIVSQAPKLGTLPGVSEIASFTQGVGSDGQGVAEAVKSLKATLAQMHEAYVKASTDYQDTNNEIADAMKRLGQNGSDSSTSTVPATTTAPSTSGPNFSA